MKISRIDSDHGNFNHAYQKMGSPEYPAAQQIRELKRASALPEPETAHTNGEITLSLPPNGVALLELA